MVNITQRELQQLVGKYAACVGEAKQTMIGKDSPQSHGPRM
jgi:hypothetical protein